MGENQFIRYAIPGWLFVLVIVSYWTITPIFDISVIVNKDNNLVPPLTFILGAGVPIGFIIYQFYFSTDWLFHKYFKVADNILHQVNDVNYPSNHMFKEIWKAQKEIQKVEYAWNKKMKQLGDSADFFNNRLRYMIIVLHSLGASFFSILLGNIAAFVFFYFIMHINSISNHLEFWSVVFIWTIILVVLFINRYYTQYNIISYQNSILLSQEITSSDAVP